MSNMTPVTFRAGALDGALAARSEARGITYGQVARQDLERYYAIVDAEARGLNLSASEWAVLRDALKGRRVDIEYLWAQVSEAAGLDGLDARHRVNTASLVDRLRKASYATRAAILDRIEQERDSEPV